MLQAALELQRLLPFAGYDAGVTDRPTDQEQMAKPPAPRVLLVDTANPVAYLKRGTALPFLRG